MHKLSLSLFAAVLVSTVAGVFVFAIRNARSYSLGGYDRAANIDECLIQ